MWPCRRPMSCLNATQDRCGDRSIADRAYLISCHDVRAHGRICSAQMRRCPDAAMSSVSTTLSHLWTGGACAVPRSGRTCIDVVQRRREHEHVARCAAAV